MYSVYVAARVSRGFNAVLSHLPAPEIDRHTVVFKTGTLGPQEHRMCCPRAPESCVNPVPFPHSGTELQPYLSWPQNFHPQELLGLQLALERPCFDPEGQVWHTLSDFLFVILNLARLFPFLFLFSSPFLILFLLANYSLPFPPPPRSSPSSLPHLLRTLVFFTTSSPHHLAISELSLPLELMLTDGPICLRPEFQATGNCYIDESLIVLIQRVSD